MVVEGVRLRDRAETFVDRAAAPARGRGLGRWQGRVCVGVVNLRADVARGIVERVSGVAADLGLRVGDEGCEANVVIVFAEDAASMVAALAEERRRAFRPGTSGLERGQGAFEAFLASDRPVRWWHLSMPVDAETGRRATRLPGDITPGGAPTAPYVSTMASRLSTQVRDDIFRALIFVDVDQLEDVTTEQLADYVALVALAQIDPEAELVGYDSILNLFVERSGAPQGLTEWDRSFLHALYTTLDEPQGPSNAASQADAVAGALARRREASSGSPTPE